MGFMLPSLLGLLLAFRAGGSSSGDFSASIRALEESLEKTPDRLDLWVSLGLFYFQSGDPEKAEEAFQKVLSLDPEHLTAWYQLALIYEKRQDWNRARSAWERVLRNAQNERLRQVSRKHLAHIRSLLQED